MYDIWTLKRDCVKSQNYHDVVTMSFSAARILITFKDGSIIRLNPGDMAELKIISNHKGVVYE